MRHENDAITHIHLPPSHRRSVKETAVLITLPLLALFVVWRLIAAAGTPTTMQTYAPAPTSPPTTPILVEVQSYIVYPTETPRPTYEPPATTPIPKDYCDARFTKQGDTCMIPDPAPPTPTPYPPCSDPMLGPGDRCVWTYEPVEVSPWQ